jgi:hypothetical protein
VGGAGRLRLGDVGVRGVSCWGQGDVAGGAPVLDTLDTNDE